MNSILDLIPEAQLEEVNSLQMQITTKQVAKGTFLQKKGAHILKCYFVKSGLLRSFTVDGKGKEHIFMFAPEGWIMGDIAAQINQAPTDLFVEVLENAELEIFDGEIMEKIHELAGSKGLQILSKRNAVLQKRIILLMSATAQERYLDFLETYPNIVQRIPQKMIASYLGITPEALSKIRQEMTKNSFLNLH